MAETERTELTALEQEVKDAGYRAKASGYKLVQDNPYESTSDYHWLWRSGWLEAHKDSQPATFGEPTVRTRKAPVLEAAENMDTPEGTVNFMVSIDGLEHQYDNKFLLKGVRARKIDWDDVQHATGELSDSLKDKIADVIFRDDLINLLAERINCGDQS